MNGWNHRNSNAVDVHYFLSQPVIFGEGWNHLIKLFQVKYLLNVLLLWNLAVIMFSKSLFYLYQRKRTMNVTFTLDFFAFINSGCAFFLGKSYVMVDNQSACWCSKFQTQNSLWRAGKDLFRTQPNINNEVFLQK